MWGGYWKRENCAVRKWAEREGAKAHFIHSGGHAWPEDLERLVSSLAPKEIVWVHTKRQSIRRAAGGVRRGCQ
jgi:mRNA degradation ribonuclease J1/J2